MHGPEIIKEARRRSRLTQEELAECSGVSQAAISRYESRRVHPTFATVERLVDAAGLQMEIELVTKVVPLGAGPIGLALARERAEVAQVLRDGGVIEAEIAGDLVIGDDIPGATLLFLVRTSSPLDWIQLNVMRGLIEVLLGCSVAVVDTDDVPHLWAEEAAGERVPFTLGAGE